MYNCGRKTGKGSSRSEEMGGSFRSLYRIVAGNYTYS